MARPGDGQVHLRQAAIGVVQQHVGPGLRLEVQGPIEEGEGLVVEAALEMPLGGAHQVAVGLGRQLGVLEVVGQLLHDLLDLAAVVPLQGFPERLV